MWILHFRSISCTHLLCQQSIALFSWSTSLWLKPDWLTSRLVKTVPLERDPYRSVQTWAVQWQCPCLCNLMQVAIEDMGLYEDLSSTHESMQVLVIFPTIFSPVMLFFSVQVWVINLPFLLSLSMLPNLFHLKAEELKVINMETYPGFHEN